MTVRGGAALGALAAALACSPVSAAADVPATPSLVVSPAPAGNRGLLVERASIYGDLLPSARALVDYALAPLVLRSSQGEIDRVVERQVVVHGLFSLSFAHRFLVHVGAPLLVDEAGDAAPALRGAPTEAVPRPGERAALGDLRVGGRAVLLRTPSDAETMHTFAVATAAWLPTASSPYVGDDALRAGASLLVEGATSRVYWAASAGFGTRPSATLPGVLPTRVGTAIVVGAAGGFFADRRRLVSVGAEAVTELTVGNDASLLDPRSTAAQTLVTAHWRPAGGPFEIGAALGPGLGQGPGSPALRALACVGFSVERAAPPPDHDRDGVPDRDDACIDSPGVSSDEPLLHGCPPPPPDRDGDAIPDARDACPEVPGRATYVPATHGCPTSPPSATPAAVATLHAEEIRIDEQIQFETNSPELRVGSERVLEAVARIMRSHAELELVEVQGHTDDAGTGEHNRQLAEARAASVVDWLVAHGVAQERLQPRGYGASRPLVEGGTDAAREKNRRVEFHVLRRASTAASPPEVKP